MSPLQPGGLLASNTERTLAPCAQFKENLFDALSGNQIHSPLGMVSRGPAEPANSKARQTMRRARIVQFD